jgi:hypothetical protein
VPSKIKPLIDANKAKAQDSKWRAKKGRSEYFNL